MKLIRLLLSLFLLFPFLIYAKDKGARMERAHEKYTKAQEQIQEANRHSDDKERSLKCLKRAIEYDERAIDYYKEYIKRARHEVSDKEFKHNSKICKKNIRICKKQIDELKDAVNNIKWSLQFREIEKSKLREIDDLTKKIHAKLQEPGGQQGAERINRLNEAIDLINKVLSVYEELTKETSHIGNSAFRDSLKNYHEQIQTVRAGHKKSIDHLKEQIEAITRQERAVQLFNESCKKAELAGPKENFSPGHLKEISGAIASLNEIAQIYDQATSGCKEALELILPYAMEADQSVLKSQIIHFENAAANCRKQAAEWSEKERSQKRALSEHLACLKNELASLEAQRLSRSCWNVQKRMIPILQELIDCGEVNAKELTILQQNIAAFEMQADARRLTETTRTLTEEEFWQREKKRVDLLFNKIPFYTEEDPLIKLGYLFHSSDPLVIPLDGQKKIDPDVDFTLYTEQFYRFLIQSTSQAAHLCVKVYKDKKMVHAEKIALPRKGDLEWDRYLAVEGMTLIPETLLKTEFGLDLRLSFVLDTRKNFSLLIAQKSSGNDYSFSFSVNETPAYTFNFNDPPPWQLAALRKPALPAIHQPLIKQNMYQTYLEFGLEGKYNEASPELESHPLLDHFVEEMKHDPLAIAQYVQNEIELVDTFHMIKDNMFQAPAIHRNAYGTFLEKQGSPWEQCTLLVYLLRKAGYTAVYAETEAAFFPKKFSENMLLTSFAHEDQIPFNYPGVFFHDGTHWISLFPWAKEMQVSEGYELYGLMPEEYSTPERWIKRYLMNDEKIMKHIGPDGDDTAGVLFVRFVEEELRKQGLSLQDVGIHRKILKKQFFSWEDFPRPITQKPFRPIQSLTGRPELFAKMKLEFSSRENPEKQLATSWIPLIELNSRTFSLHFTPCEGNGHLFHLGLPGKWKEELLLNLDPTDLYLDVKISYDGSMMGLPIEPRTLSFAKGTSAALCHHFGASSAKITSLFGQQFAEQNEPKEKLHSLLSFIGAAYFEKCNRSEKKLAALHKSTPQTFFGFGLVKLSPDLSQGPVVGEPDLKFPQVDMIQFSHAPFHMYPFVWHQENNMVNRQLLALTCVDSSSNEHQVLREIFQDPYAISTVKLLQIAHLEHQSQGLAGPGFLTFTNRSFREADQTQEAAQIIHFSHLKNPNLRKIKAFFKGQWEATRKYLNGNSDSEYTYAYMTPYLVSSQDGSHLRSPSYTGMGTLIIHPSTCAALISDNQTIMNGGFGSRLRDGCLEGIKNGHGKSRQITTPTHCSRLYCRLRTVASPLHAEFPQGLQKQTSDRSTNLYSTTSPTRSTSSQALFI